MGLIVQAGEKRQQMLFHPVNPGYLGNVDNFLAMFRYCQWLPPHHNPGIVKNEPQSTQRNYYIS